MRREQELKARGEDVKMEEDVSQQIDDDPVPEITVAHFEEAMRFARRSVSDADIRRYEMFASTLQQSRGNFGNSGFKFPEGGIDDSGNGNGNAPAGNAAAPSAAPAFGNDEADDDLYA